MESVALNEAKALFCLQEIIYCMKSNLELFFVAILRVFLLSPCPHLKMDKGGRHNKHMTKPVDLHLEVWNVTRWFNDWRLSAGFCTAPKMLVCLLLSAYKNCLKFMGSWTFSVTMSSSWMLLLLVVSWLFHKLGRYDSCFLGVMVWSNVGQAAFWMMHAGRCKTGESFFLFVIPGLHHFFEAVAEIKNMFYKNMAICLKFSKGLEI